jgi:geranylgeranyl reductase
MTRPQTYDAIVVGGGPAGATAATELARAGKSVVLLDRAGRIKPCGGAIPPRLIRDFEIPQSLLCARISGARIVSPSERTIDMPIDGGYVGMVNRETFDEYLRERAAEAGAIRETGRYRGIERDANGCAVVHYQSGTRADPGPEKALSAKLVVGADGARSKVAEQEVPGSELKRWVYAYHEIVETPSGGFDGSRCDVVYSSRFSPDFYGWVFPHGDTVSVGSGSAHKGFGLRGAVQDLRDVSGLAKQSTVRREGAPLPLQPLKRWDNGRDVILAGDAAGVVAPSSGEGIYYAMVSGQHAAEAGVAYLETASTRALKLARKRFMKEHGRVFWILGLMQHFWYSSDKRRERFVSMCADPDVQRLTWEAYMNKKLVRARPGAHARIFFKDVAHLLGFVAPS